MCDTVAHKENSKISGEVLDFLSTDFCSDALSHSFKKPMNKKL